MKKQYLISLIVIALTLAFALIGAAGSHGANYTLYVGLTCCVAGLVWVFVGVIFAVRDKTRDIGYGFLIGAGITFLIGTGVCSTLLG